MNRRSFTRNGLLLAGAQVCPASSLLASAPQAGSQAASQAASQPGGTRVGFAAVGLGTISDIFMRACANSTSAKITALVSGHPEKAAKYAAQYGVPQTSIYSYESFDRIRDNPAVEAVYIGLPNSMHREYTVRAAQAGKHVLCEKPMAISSAECRTMIEACRAANRKLMIAYRIQYEPLWKQVADTIASGAIGQIQSFQGGFFNNQSKGAWRLSRTLGGGGSVLDLGIYPLNTVRWLTGEEPSAFTAVTATRDRASGRFDEVEQSIEFTFKLPSGIIASCGCSYGQSGPGFLNIQGDRGALFMNPGFNYDGLHLTGRTANGPLDIASPGKNAYQFVFEADHFAACIRENKEPRTPGEEGLRDMLAIEAIYKAAGSPIA